MDKEQYRAAKARLVAQMQEGQSWQVAAVTAGVQTSQSTAYRLLQTLLQERFDLSVSISQINRVRAALGGSLRRQHQEQGKKQK